MKRFLLPLFAAAALSLSGCASLFTPPVAPGDTEDQVVARLGPPTGVYPDGNTRLLEYAGGAFGQYSYMARIGPDGRLVSYDQVLTSENFAKVKVDQWTKDDILRHFGRPAEVTGVYYHNYEVWSYRYKEAGVWNSLMSVHFDQQGVVRQMLNGPDPMFDERLRHR